MAKLIIVHIQMIGFSYPDSSSLWWILIITSKGDTLSNNLQNGDLSFGHRTAWIKLQKRKPWKKNQVSWVEKIAPRFKAAKAVLTQDEKAYIDRLTQALTYNFIRTISISSCFVCRWVTAFLAYTIYLLLRYFNQSCCLSEMKVLPITSQQGFREESIKHVLP